LNEFWESFHKQQKWPSTRAVYSRYGTDVVQEALSPLTGNVVREEPGQSGQKVFQLSALGMTMTERGKEFEALLSRFLELQRELFLKDPEKQQLTSEEITTALKLSPAETEILGKMIGAGFYGAGGSQGQTAWTVNAMKEAEKFPRSGGLSKQVELGLMQHYASKFHVFEEQRRQNMYSPSIQSSAPYALHQPGSGDPVFLPVAIQESLNAFQADHAHSEKTCFIMMQFADTSAHSAIESAIKATLEKYGFEGLLARDKEYNDEMLANIQTYLHGCGFGIAVFERIQKENFNPNVSLEVGYMMGHKKKLLLLKDKTLEQLQTDLVGKLYRPFDVLHPGKTIPPQVEKWMEEKGLI
jgi:hypothetical protein